MHAQPLARLSRALDTLISNSETKASVIDWKDTDEETFLRFCEFAYVQDYSPPRFSTGDSREPSQDAYGRQLFQSPGSTPGKGITFDKFYPVPSSNKSFRQQFEPTYNSPILDPSGHGQVLADNWHLRDFEPVLIGHARLYLLADKYDVPELQNLVLHKLYHTMEKSELHENQVAGVLKLVQFAYPPNSQYEASATSQFESQSTALFELADPMSDKELRVGGLRQLVARIVVLKLDTVGKNDAFIDRLQLGGDFVKDFWIALRDNARFKSHFLDFLCTGNGY